MPSTGSPVTLRNVVEEVVGAAVRAPSVHNTQPWLFRLAEGDVLEVRADRSRSLTAIDPDGRELAISCGAAIAYAEVALAALGAAAETTLMPVSGDDDLLAQVLVTGRREASDDAEALHAAVSTRATWRGRMSDESVPDDVFAQLRAEVTAADAGVQELDHNAWVRGAVLQSHAAAVQDVDPVYHEELRVWTGRDERASDGVPQSAVPAAGAGPHSTWVLREFDEHGSGALAAGGSRPEQPRILVVSTEQDHPRDWLIAGQAFARAALRAEVLGLASSPLTQVTEVLGARASLRRLAGGGWPQLLLRVGYGEHPSPTPRRPVVDVLEIMGEA